MSQPQMASTASLPLGSPTLVHDRLKLSSVTVAQSFAFDASTRQLYVAQVSVGGEAAGNLTITRMDWGSGKVTGTMHLRGFGHGVAIGVESNPNSKLTPRGAWLWVECGPITKVKGSARGSRICRLAFVPGRTVSCTSEGVITAKTSKGVKVRPDITILRAPGPRCTPSVDGDHLGLRWWDGSHYRWAAFDLASAKHGNLVRVSQERALVVKGLFQGWCLSGSHAICVLGSAGEPAEVVDLDLAGASTVISPTSIKAKGYSEPEGAAMIDGDLHIGTATGSIGARRLTIHRV